MRPSWKKSPGGYGESFDRFSNIPDDLVHEILCFLPIKDIVRISLVSKRFRQPCLSVPDLFLDFESQSLEKLGNWTDWFLSLRNGAKLRRFVLKMNAFPFQQDNIQVCNWIHNATVICRAEELDLSFGMSEEECFSLPLSTFVRTIKMNLYYGVLKLPSSSSTTISSSFSSLQVLKIRNITIGHNLSEDWVSSLFPAIKKLKLQCVGGIDNLNITSSSLECLKIVACDLHRVVVSAERLHTLRMMFFRQDWLFRIYAPSLRKVHWTDNQVSFLRSPMCLQNVNMDAPMLVESTAANKSKNLLVLLQFINHAQSVILPCLLEKLFRHDSLQYELDNVQNLDLHSFAKKDHKVPALASLFGRLPNLKTLTLRCFDLYPIGYESNNLLALEQRKFDIEYWESQDVSFIHQLKEAKIEINTLAFEVGLIKYFIKHAKALERMTVTFARNIDISRSRPFCEKLSEFYETFSDATLDFVLK